ncbi:hypothetical protein SISSUDRAFT_988521 [Sistotremastrum suecicum HHB10207 ss-3]|nr:hypothetical protein SISSUDRAFT_988521 [Sistotremastrum suecicum HHB10207 ss-3]
MPASVLGTLTRLGILALCNYDGNDIFPLAWVQATGCFVMGFAVTLKDPLGDFYGPLYTAITTGFCGSVTTFSSWQIDVFSAWANTGHFHRAWIRDVVDGLGRSVFTIAISLSSVALGSHLARVLFPNMPRWRPPPPFIRHFLVVFSVVIYALTIPFFVRLNHSWRPKATAALMFSFPGTLTRYTLAWALTPRLKIMPLGTLTANSVATGLLAGFHALQATGPGSHPVSCDILQGLIDGYCGCLSTISTFAVEIRSLKGKRAWLYVGTSWIIGQLLCLVILGPSWWHAKLNETPTCTTTS